MMSAMGAMQASGTGRERTDRFPICRAKADSGAPDRRVVQVAPRPWRLRRIGVITFDDNVSEIDFYRDLEPIILGYILGSVSAWSYTRIASTILTADAVGMTRVRRKPALPRSSRYSASVRSWPPGATSITMSSILPGCGSSP